MSLDPKDYGKALKYYELAAAQGNVEALYIIGWALSFNVSIGLIFSLHKR